MVETVGVGGSSLCLFQYCSNCRKHTLTHTNTDAHTLSKHVSDWLYVTLCSLFLTHEFYPGGLFSFSRLGQFFQDRVKPGSSSCHVKSLKRCDFQRIKDSAYGG